MTYRLISLGAIAIAVAGCQPQTPDRNAAALVNLQPAQYCDATLPFFGHYRHIGRRNSGPLFQPADGRITMRNDGGWCSIQHKFAYEGLVLTAPMTLTVPPRHGEVVLGSLQEELRLAYRPAPGYAGPDAFEARLDSPVPETIPVRVTVQP
jgi:hypothetical protein